MAQLIPSRFKFALYFIDSKNQQVKYNNTNNNNQNQQYTICYADSYEINTSGAIIFYQIFMGDDGKKFKIPVLSYPQGKWEGCVLLDNNHEFPVFKPSSHNSYILENEKKTESEDVELSNSGNSTVAKSNILQQLAQTLNIQMPGIQNNNNPQEYKKQKEEWLENEIKQYLKNEEFFEINKFLYFIQKNSQSKHFKPNETDVIWSCSKLIRSKNVISRKFYEPTIQKTLSLILPDIMKRQWDGKMAPILQTLQEREETKNVNAIDLAVWMSQNNYT